MSLTLYRKYRPQLFSEVIGQEYIKKTIENELKIGRTSHAYLFYGPRGTGKTTLGRILAKSLNCQKRKEGQSEPCNQCSSCLDSMQGKNFDLIEIDAASHTQVDKVRENIIENIKFLPSRSHYKVFIIDEIHMLSQSAFNALLKSLEEPPSYVIFILCTTEVHKLPKTIVSRCQKFNFSKVSPIEIFDRLKKITKLEKIKIDEDVLKNIARLSQGHVRDAESLLAQVLSLGDKEITKKEAEIILPYSEFEKVAELIGYLFQKNSQQAIELINQSLESGVDLKQFNISLVEFLRQILLVKISGGKTKDVFIIDKELEKNLLSLSEKIEINNLVKIIEELIKIRTQLETSEIPQLPIELAVIKICHL